MLPRPDLMALLLSDLIPPLCGRASPASMHLRRAAMAVNDRTFADLHSRARMLLPKVQPIPATKALGGRTWTCTRLRFQTRITASQSQFGGTHPASASEVRCVVKPAHANLLCVTLKVVSLSQALRKTAVPG